MVTMVGSVLLIDGSSICIGQKAVEAPVPAQHFCEPAGDYPNVSLAIGRIIKCAQVSVRDPAKVLSINKRTIKKLLFILPLVHCVIMKSPTFS